MRWLVLALCSVACGSRPAPTKHAEPKIVYAPPEGLVPELAITVRGARHRMEFGAYAVEVDADDGGRIVEFSLEGKNVLATREESPAAYGTSFWPSPQSDWDWPPPPELDRLPWAAKVEGTTLVLASSTNAALGLDATARIQFDSMHGSLAIRYTLSNRGSSPRRVAPWQNSRVRPSGLTFYPSSGPTLPPSTLELPLIDGVAWLLHDPKTMTENRKSFADGSEGFLAHVEGDLLFLKAWRDVPREKQAPGEAEIELYVDKTGLFVEIEQQGPYEELAPGASLSWVTGWVVERLDPTVKIAPGSPSLVAAARRLAKRYQEIRDW